MKTSEEVKHFPTIFKQLVTNKSKLELVRRIRERLISILKPITPPKAKLKNFDYAAVFCLESLKNQENKLYENALTLLKMCNDALESGKVKPHHINAIQVLYGKADQAREVQELISEDRKAIAPLVKAGKDHLDMKKKAIEYGRMSAGQQKNEAILSSIINEIENGGKNLPASLLWNYFKRNYNGIANRDESNVYMNEDIATGEYRIYEYGEFKGITFNTFRGYVTAARKKIKNNKK